MFGWFRNFIRLDVRGFRATQFNMVLKQKSTLIVSSKCFRTILNNMVLKLKSDKGFTTHSFRTIQNNIILKLGTINHHDGTSFGAIANNIVLKPTQCLITHILFFITISFNMEKQKKLLVI